ncbi:hypothetical protein N7532_000705 [Penicillium argentinense]|uniref:NF-kappa-B inhibitor-like protein 1 n=1 Tax=Penicillium argentinense TaxID=1131581 RepID=A0A9W9G5S4_9EURO|nr:uncharacterized protein N7532_000705 [Penicillium argentinense]KAJ5112660.1 hypothetical protein N7532_000705 [Penicillium argentinense]
MTSTPEESDGHKAEPADDKTKSTRSKRFRFKDSDSKHSSSSHRRRHHSRDRHGDRGHRHRSSHHSHRSKRRSRSRSPNSHDPRNSSLDAEAAFRESLFDALGDDEGAAYWESVYGQPIHHYAVPEVPKGPDGELERMDEEEYAAYVRARMWERTREGMLEAQEKLREERRQAKMRENAARGRERERGAFERAMEESLRRGAERKKKKAWVGVWEEYLKCWEEIAKIVQKNQGPTSTGSSESRADESTSGGTGPTSKPLRDLLFWPVESGKRRDVSPESVEAFMKHAPPSGDLLSTLKVERVRWHPDKIQHRYGALGIDEKVIRSVTEVFQIVDRMWSEERERAGKS